MIICTLDLDSLKLHVLYVFHKLQINNKKLPDLPLIRYTAGFHLKLRAPMIYYIQ